MSPNDPLDAPYARYLGLETLFALQGDPPTLHHPDELQFRTVHLVSELWLRLVATEMARAGEAIAAGDLLPGRRLLDRCARAADLLVAQLGLLETMTPADYHVFRVHLGEASGLQSPGYLAVRRGARALWAAFAGALAARDLDLLAVYERHAEPDCAPLHDLAEALLALDEALQRFRHRHLLLARRFLGEDTVGTGGQGIDFLRRTLDHALFPDVRRVRSDLAAGAGAPSYASPPLHEGEGAEG